MIFATPLGLLALVSIPAIVAIHLFRRRFPIRATAGLFLWQATRRVPEGGGKIERLPITASLLLECLAALALSLILAGARLSSAAVSEHLVVLLDDSASMSARNAAGERPRDRAVRRVLDELERLGRGVRVTLLASGERPVVIAGPAAPALDARAALERWEPRAPHHAFALGLQMMRELAGRTGRMMVLSDASPATQGEDEVTGALWVAVGESLPNLGIVAAERTLAPEQGRGTIALALGNYASAPAARQVRVLAGEKEVSATQVTAPPGLSSVKLPIPTGLPAVRVVLSDDALARDNEVVLVEPRPQVVAVENRLTDGRGRQALIKALGVLPNVTSAEAGHLQFVAGEALDSAPSPGVWRVGFGQAPARVRAPGEPQDFIGPFVMEKRHPLLQGVTLGGVVWTGAAALSPGAVRPLVSASDRAVLAVIAETGSDTTLLFNLDLERTNLIRTPDWPILIANLIEMRRQNLPGPERWNYRIGERVRARLDHTPKAPLSVRLGSVSRTLPSGTAIDVVAPAAGGLLQILEGEQALFEVGVNFLDDSESDLRTRGSAEVGAFDRRATGLRAESGPASDPLFWVLLATAALAIVANWWVLSAARSHA